jgi:F0F1-type ATP synthase assembly protein I
VDGNDSNAVKTTARIDWRKLLLLTLLVMVLPTISALLLDGWLGTLPLITIVAILICFPTAIFLVIRIALLEMERVIAEVAPPSSTELLPDSDTIVEPEIQNDSSSTP